MATILFFLFFLVGTQESSAIMADGVRRELGLDSMYRKGSLAIGWMRVWYGEQKHQWGRWLVMYCTPPPPCTSTRTVRKVTVRPGLGASP